VLEVPALGGACETCSMSLCVLEQMRVEKSSSGPIKRGAQLGAIGYIGLRSILCVDITQSRYHHHLIEFNLFSQYCSFGVKQQSLNHSLFEEIPLNALI